MRLLSFNVNGIRAIIKRDFTKDMLAQNLDVICLQETKATAEQVRETLLFDFPDYEIYANGADRKGYSGTAILTRKKPLSVTYDMGVEKHDSEGRVIAMEFPDYYLVTVYTPNSGSELLRLEYRQDWDKEFLAYLKNLEKSKPVIVCGDLNVAHTSIDLARPKENYNKTAGHMQEEIDGMDAYIDNGFIDTFRHVNGNQIKYSWWSYRGGARERNVGWRIDYFLVSNTLKDKINEAEIRNDIHGSDHCPVLLELI